MIRRDSCRRCCFIRLLINVTNKAEMYDSDRLPNLASPYRKMANQLEALIEGAKVCTCF